MFLPLVRISILAPFENVKKEVLHLSKAVKKNMNKVFFNIRKYNLKITCDANDFMQFDYSAFPEKSNFPEQEKNSITWRHQSMCAIFGGVALRICCVDSLPCTGIVLLILLANSTSNTIFLRKIVKGLRITCCFKQSEYVLQIDRFGHFPSKSELLIFAECLPLCIYEVGWVHCALASRNKSPPCEVSDRLLGTLEKVQNNIGGNTGQSSSPRLWNTLINANKGWTWMICGTRLPPNVIKWQSGNGLEIVASFE